MGGRSRRPAVAGAGATRSGRRSRRHGPDLALGGRPGSSTRRPAGSPAASAAAGLQPGDRVLWSTTSSVAALAAHVGALRAGLVVVPANPSYSRRELVHIVDDVQPAAAIVERSDQAEWVRGASPAIITMGPDVDLPEADPGPLDGADPDAPALICYTSGTTGAPKGAVLTHRNLLAATEAVRIAWRWSPDDRLVHCLPVFHAHGLCVGVYGTLLAGASAVLLPGFDPSAVAERPGPKGPPCSSASPPCTTGWSHPAGAPSSAPCACACPGRPRCHPNCTPKPARRSVRRCSNGTA